MKLYPPYLILQQQVASVTTLNELKDLCHKLALNVEVKCFFSTFSSLVWDLSHDQVKGTLNAHIFTTISGTDGSHAKTTASPPFPVHFETSDLQPLKQLEREIINAICQSLNS